LALLVVCSVKPAVDNFWVPTCYPWERPLGADWQKYSIHKSHQGTRVEVPNLTHQGERDNTELDTEPTFWQPPLYLNLKPLFLAEIIGETH